MNGFDSEQHKVFDFWQGKRLTPAQLLVHDVKLEERDARPPRLSINEIPASNLVPDALEEWLRSCNTLPDTSVGNTGSERGHIESLVSAYGWLSCFRSTKSDDALQCRWIHISSKFPEYIEGVLAGLSDWSHAPDSKLEQIQQLNSIVRSNERWSKHGRFFSPFFSPLTLNSVGDSSPDCPFLLSIPFLDWTTYPDPTPPLRFQIDKREGYASSRSTAHPLR